MQFDVTTTYPGKLENVLDVLLSEELAAARATQMRSNLTHTRSGNSATTSGTVNPDELPQMARRFISANQEVAITQDWTTTGENATGTFTVKAGSLPVHVTMTQTLTDQGESTASAITGDVKVKIPLIGSKVEKMVVEKLDTILARDTKLVAGLL